MEPIGRSISTAVPSEGLPSEFLPRQRLDALTHARLWRNPCGFSARFNYLAMRYNVPLYGWVQERFGLARVEFAVLYNLALHPDITASEIATTSGFPKNTLSRAVNRLFKLGLIQRRADKSDRRQQYLNLMPAGQAIFDEALPRFVGLEQEMLASLTLVERETLANLLAKVVLSTFHGDGEDPADSVDYTAARS